VIRKFVLASVLSVLVMMGGTAWAAPRASISVNQQASDLRLGGYVVFDFHTNHEGYPNPWIALRCFQNGVLVLMDDYGMWADPAHPFPLGPTDLWQSGAVECRGELYRYSKNLGRKTVQATVTFEA
jgi:hypothetical protein